MNGSEYSYALFANLSSQAMDTSGKKNHSPNTNLTNKMQQGKFKN
jgi:hypothetical protein